MDFVENLKARYDEYVVHAVDLESSAAAAAFVMNLPFVHEGMSPEHIQCATTEEQPNGGATALIGGQLTAAENLAVRAGADAVAAQRLSVCEAEEGSSVYQAFRDAGCHELVPPAEEAAAATDAASPKPWWRFW